MAPIALLSLTLTLRMVRLAVDVIRTGGGRRGGGLEVESAQRLRCHVEVILMRRKGRGLGGCKGLGEVRRAVPDADVDERRVSAHGTTVQVHAQTAIRSILRNVMRVRRKKMRMVVVPLFHSGRRRKTVSKLRVDH